MGLMGSLATLSETGRSAVANPAPLKVLFVGNSQVFFNDMPRLFQELCKSTGLLAPEVGAVTKGSTSIAQHMEGPDLPPVLRRGTPSDNTPWGVIVIQEHTQVVRDSARDNTVAEKAAAAIADLAGNLKFRNPKTLFVFLEVGAVHVRMYEGVKGFDPKLGPTAMQREIRAGGENIVRLAKAKLPHEKMRLLLCPAGQFRELARHQLPAINLHDADGSHPGPVGSWVTALALLGSIGGRVCIDKATWWGGATEAEAQPLKKLLLDHPAVFTAASNI